MKTMTKAEALRMILKHKKIKVLGLAKNMGITHPTIKKLIDDPDKMTGVQRRAMADSIGVPVGVIDDICNGRFSA